MRGSGGVYGVSAYVEVSRGMGGGVDGPLSNDFVYFGGAGGIKFGRSVPETTCDFPVVLGLDYDLRDSYDGSAEF